MSQYLIRSSSIDQPDPYQKQQYYLQEQKRISAMLQTPLVKMSYNDYLIKKDNKIISINVPDNSKHKEYEEIFKNRQRYEQQIAKFMTQDKTNGGGYYFYSWISNDQFCCDVPTEGVPLLATHIFSLQYDKAYELVLKWDKNIITQILLVFFRGFMNLFKIVENNPQLRKIYLKRQTTSKQFLSPQNKELSQNKLLLCHNTVTQTILDTYPTLEQKKQCILANLNYLKKFIGYLPNHEINDYYQLIFAFLSNVENQLQSKGMYNMLLNCRELNLLDRFNFVQKLVPLEDRKQFVQQFQHKMMSLTHLSNLLLFTTKDEVKIQRIISNYLDQYGDLQSVAQVCLQYATPNLMKYIDMYQQVLVLSCEFKKAKNLQKLQLKKLGSYCLKRKKSLQPPKLFLNYVNFNQQKILTQSLMQPHQHWKQDSNKICYVCFHQNEPNQGLFVQCGRCRHGGHLNHLLKWYAESNNVCPKTDCPCYCV